MTEIVTITKEELQELLQVILEEHAIRPSVKQLEPLYNQQDALRLFGCSDKTLAGWARKGLVKIVAVGGRRYVTGESIAKLIEAS